MCCLRLILGDQLNINHSWFNKAERSRRDIIYVLMEVRCETDYVVHHAQKILGIFAAMRAFAAALHKAGLAVHYLRLNDQDNQQDFVANLAILAQRYGATHIERQHADEYRLEHHLSTQLTRLGLDIRVVDSEHFLLPRQEAV
ncbi:MAG TPA: cryptochrome/photolyase family protein, partial [Cellvibrionaceae bacterium]|nr:cryptochrome/photolyase family protein [Cellvibrionaceae bacterium]